MILMLLAVLLADEITFTVRTPPKPSPPAAAAAAVAPDPQGYYVVAYTAAWCGPCQRWKRDELAALKTAGVAVTIVDVDKDPQWNRSRWATDSVKNERVLIPAITSLPTFQIVRRSDRIPVWRGVGYTTAKALAGRIPAAPQRESQAPAPAPPDSG
jgi:glutaredoxin